MAVPPYNFGAVAAATDRMHKHLQEHHSSASDCQGWMAIFQLLAAAFLSMRAWGCSEALYQPGSLAALALLTVWHSLGAGPVLSPLAYAVPLLQALLHWLCPLRALEAALSLPLVLLAVSVNQRALESCVHEASHHTLYRSAHLNGCTLPDQVARQQKKDSSKKDGHYFQLQRLVSTSFAALIFRDIEAYHQSHSIHHRHFADSARDPDSIIYERAMATSWADVGRATCQWYWENSTGVLSFFSRPGQRLTIAGVLAILVALLGSAEALSLGALWMAAYLVVLPPLRMVSEHEEHVALLPQRQAFVDWIQGDVEYAAQWQALAAEPEQQAEFEKELVAKVQWTMSRTNVGWLHDWVFHPCGDGWHAVHHLSPRVPFHRLRTAHQDLEAIEPIFKALCHRNTVPLQCAFEWAK